MARREIDHDEPGHRCAECWPFAPGSDAEAAWARGERVGHLPDLLPRESSLPSRASYLAPVLPGDVEIAQARAEALASLRPSLLGCAESEEGSRERPRSEEPPVERGSAASPGPDASPERQEVPSSRAPRR